MYFQQISIKNFKAVKEMELEFTPGVNLLTGDNGVGKTSVLEAIASGLCGMLKGVQDVSVKGIQQSDIHFYMEERGDASSEIHYVTPVEIACTLKGEQQEFHWKRIRKDENGYSRTKMEDDGIEKWMRTISNDSSAVLPLISFQSDARSWPSSRGSAEKDLKKKLNDRRCGYIGCLDYSLDIGGIRAWCLKMELNAFQKKREIKEYEAFKGIVAAFMKKIDNLETAPDIYYSSQLEQLVYQEGDMSMPVSNLSAGYQSLLWIVMNLAYRLALLNPEQSENLKNTEGIVLIDEVDMHLHPKWQWNIVGALEETFPNIQFILATHSPIVIASCKNRQMVWIGEDQEVMYLKDAYGYSVQEVLKLRQGTTEKPREIKEIFEQFDEAIQKDELGRAEKMIGKMEELLGDDHMDVKGAKDELQLNRWIED